MERQAFGPSGSNPVAEDQFRKGFELAKSGNLDEAILAVEAAIAVSPDESRYHDLMGTLYAKKGLYEMAVSEWKRSIECDPTHAEVFRRIETANKLRAQVPVRGDRWGWAAAALTSVLFVGALAWGTYQVRNQGAVRDALAEAQTALAGVEENYVPKSDHQTILDMSEELSATIGSLENQLAERDGLIAELKDDSKFVPKETFEAEAEKRSQIESELRAARDQVVRLQQQLEAVGDTSGSTALAQTLTAKEQELADLAANYKTLNDDRLRLENELKTARDRVVNLESEVDNLRKEGATAAAGPATIATSEIHLAPLLEGSLKAIADVQAGNVGSALAALRTIERENPNTPGLQSAIAAIAPPTPEPTSVATVPPPAPTPTAAPTPRPTTAPRPTVAPTSTPVPRPSGPVTPARPRPVGGSATIAERPQPAPTRPPAAPRDDRAEQARRLQQQKASLTQQAYQAYQGREFNRAKQLIEQAYRIDPRDPAINQLRGAIDRALSQ